MKSRQFKMVMVQDIVKYEGKGWTLSNKKLANKLGNVGNVYMWREDDRTS